MVVGLHPTPSAVEYTERENVSRSRTMSNLKKGKYKLIHELGGVSIAQISPDLVLKYGRGAFMSEAATMRYVKARTSIRLPTVHDA